MASAILTDAQSLEITSAAATMECAPYVLPGESEPTRLARAVALVQGCKVETTDAPDTWVVQGSDRSYTVHPQGCQCPASTKGKSKWCYHLVAAALWDRVQSRSDMAYRSAFDALVHTTTPTIETSLLNDLPTDDALAAQGWEVEIPTPEPPVLAAAQQHAPQALLLARPQGTLRPIAAIIHDLSQPLPDACVATRQQQGQTIRYLHWWDVTLLLDTYAPGWQGEIVRSDEFARDEVIERRQGTVAQVHTCVVTYRLSIPCLEGLVSREAIGREASHEPIAYGDLTSNASASALTRAAAMFGLGVWLREKEQTSAALRQHLLKRSYETLGQACELAGQDKADALGQVLKHAGVTRKAEVPLWVIKKYTANLQ